MPGFDELHPDHSLAVRSIAEYFETTAVRRPVHLHRRLPEHPVGQPGVRDRALAGPAPARPRRTTGPAVHPLRDVTGRTAEEVGFPGEAAGAFTSTLLEALTGTGTPRRGPGNATATRSAGSAWRPSSTTGCRASEGGGSPGGPPVQIPQDTGARGSPAATATCRWSRSRAATSTLSSRSTPRSDAQRKPRSACSTRSPRRFARIGVTGQSRRSSLRPRHTPSGQPPRPRGLSGSVKPRRPLRRPPVTIDLLPARQVARGAFVLQPEETPVTEPIELDPATRGLSPAVWGHDLDRIGRRPRRGRDRGRGWSGARGQAGGRNSSGRARVLLCPAHRPRRDARPQFVRLTAGESERVTLKPRPADTLVEELASAMGGRVRDGYLTMGDDAIAWARPTTVVTAGLAKYLAGDEPAAMAAGRRALSSAMAPESRSSPSVSAAMGVRTSTQYGTSRWRSGEPASRSSGRGELQPVGRRRGWQGKAVDAAPHWVSFTAPDAAPMVVAVPVLPQRLATLVAQIDSDRIRLYQYHPSLARGASADVSRYGASSTSSGCCSPDGSTSQTASHGSWRQQRPRIPSQESSPVMCYSAWGSMKNSAPSPQRSSRLLPP